MSLPYKDKEVNAKCRNLKKLICKGTCGRCCHGLQIGDSQFLAYTYSIILVFSTQLCALSPVPLSPSFWFNSPPPLPCVNKYTVYKYTVCDGGLRQINTPAYKTIFQMTTFCIAFYESYLSTIVTKPIRKLCQATEGALRNRKYLVEGIQHCNRRSSLLFAVVFIWVQSSIRFPAQLTKPPFISTCYFFSLCRAELEFVNNLCGLGAEQEQGYHIQACQATQAGGIHSLESIPVLHKRLKIRAQVHVCYILQQGGGGGHSGPKTKQTKKLCIFTI